jgi:DNA-binding HxlR family transcriptional regulator
LSDRSPKPGTPVRGSHTGRPVMALLDLLGRRWTLRIIWELRNGPLTARTLRSRCDGASPTVLHARLSELRDARLVELEPRAGYRLTTEGEAFIVAFMPLHDFAERWAAVQASSP